MDQERSLRLLKHLNHIKTMVDYLEVSGHLLTSGIITITDHHSFVGLVNLSGNAKAMEELVTVLRLRRNGFSAFVHALRANDYNWLAEQLDPEQLQSCTRIEDSRRGSTLHRILRRKSSRNSEARLSGETVFTTYRQSFPMDLSSSTRSLNHCHTLTKSFDSLNINLNPNLEPPPEVVENKRKRHGSSSALLLNVPVPVDHPENGPRDSEIVSKIAAEFNFEHPESLSSLKRINVASKSPTKSKDKGRSKKLSGGKMVNLKIKFKTRDARDRFVEGVNSVSADLGGVIRGVPLDSKSGQSGASQNSSTITTGNPGWFRKLLKKR